MTKLLKLLGLLVLVSIPAAAQDYEIMFNPPLKAGQRYKLTAVNTETTQSTMTAPQRAPKVEKKELGFEWESVGTILDVDASGNPTKESHIVVKLNRIKGPAREVLLSTGAKVVASRENNKSAFEVDGKPAPPELVTVLKEVMSIRYSGIAADMFGTKERKKVGDSWSIDEERTLDVGKKELVAKNMDVQKVTGKTTLQKVTKDGDTDVLQLTGNLTAKITPPPQDGPTPGEVTMAATMTGAFPVDATNGTKEENFVRTMNFKMSGKAPQNGAVIQLTGFTKQTSTTKVKFLK